MKAVFVILFLAVLQGTSVGQTTTGKATTTGVCSPATTGHHNHFTITCNVDTQQGDKMVTILNTILKNQIDPTTVMAKLDEILKNVNPNLATVTYMCNGQTRSAGPGPTAAMEVKLGEINPIFKQMIDLSNERQFPQLLEVCTDQIKTNPQWLTPLLTCSLADYALGDNAKAIELLKEFDSKKGPAYDDVPCMNMSNFLHHKLLP